MTEIEQRQQLRALSLELFGKPNRWRKLLEKGYLDEAKGDEKLNKEGKPYAGRVRRSYTRETLLAKMQELRAEKDAPKAK